MSQTTKKNVSRAGPCCVNLNVYVHASTFFLALALSDVVRSSYEIDRIRSASL